MADGKFGNVALPSAHKTVLLVGARYTGTKTDTGFNPEGDSDPTGQNQLVASAINLGFSVITVGDVPLLDMSTVVNNVPCQLGEFWTQTQWKSLAAQCSLRHVNGEIPWDSIKLVMKTGAMFFPALLGIPTVYIEDSQIPSTATARMRQWTKPDSLQLYRRLEVLDPPSLPEKGARIHTVAFNDEVRASNERQFIGEAKWRIIGILFGLRGKWINITGLATELVAISDINDVVNGSTPQTLQTWKTKINALPDTDCQMEGLIRGYTADDLTKVETALKNLRTDYSGPMFIGNMIVRKSGETYATRTQ